MGKFAGGFLRITATFIYFLEFLCAAIGLAVFSYFLAKLSYHDIKIDADWKAVEGLTGVAVIYTILAVVLTVFLGGNRVFAVLGIILNIFFCGAFIAVAVLTKDGSDSCHATIVTTPLGRGAPGREGPAGTNLGLACKLNTAVFATAVIAALLFLISAVLQYFIMRNHLNEKKYGPSPANNYTSGRGDRKFWQRKPKTTRDAYGNEMSTAGGLGSTNGTTTTSDTYGSSYGGSQPSYKPDTYRTTHGTTQPTAHPGPFTSTHGGTQPVYQTDNSVSGYHTGPVGQSVNPYGYSNQPNPGTNY